MKNSVLLIPLLLCSCKHMDSLYHSEMPVTHHVTINFGEKMKSLLREEAQEEIKQMKKIHHTEHQQMSELHRDIERKIDAIHEKAEQALQSKHKNMELKVDKLIKLYETIQTPSRSQHISK